MFDQKNGLLVDIETITATQSQPQVRCGRCSGILVLITLFAFLQFYSVVRRNSKVHYLTGSLIIIIIIIIIIFRKWSIFCLLRKKKKKRQKKIDEVNIFDYLGLFMMF